MCKEKFGKLTTSLWGRRKCLDVGDGMKRAVDLLHVMRIEGIRRKAPERERTSIGRGRANETLSLMWVAGRNPQRDGRRAGQGWSRR